MRVLLIVVCNHDISLACKLLQRISQLGGWAHFDRLHLHLDSDVPLGGERDALAVTPLNRKAIAISRSNQPSAWITRRSEVMLQIYRLVCAADCDIVKLDPDLFIASKVFFERIVAPFVGIAGKLMNFHLPALVRGQHLDFIQGGVTCWGEDGRDFLNGLSTSAVQRFAHNVEALVQLGLPSLHSEYKHFFRFGEDVVLTGVMAINAGVKRQNIPDIQVSSYDVLKNFRSGTLSYADIINAFERSKALAYHFEGRHWGHRTKMSSILKQYYSNFLSDTPPR